jgi:hypothetical protein
MPLREAEEMASVGRFGSSLEKVTSDAPWKPYALALAAVFTALLVREVLAAILGINLFAVFFLPAVMVTGSLAASFRAYLLPFSLLSFRSSMWSRTPACIFHRSRTC